MRKLTNIEQCEFALKLVEALWKMAERRNKKAERRNKKLEKLKVVADEYIENLEQENHNLKIDNAQITANLYKYIYPKLAKKKIKERKAK